jgi:filamentous hemagglutinin
LTAAHHALWRRITAAVLTGVMYFAPVVGNAQIVAAPDGKGPAVATTPSGIPLVQINRPSAAGVSDNHYSQFSTSSSGAVLNNSPTSVQTQLGGWVPGNPNLTSGAKIILNQVTGTTPSRLGGPIEVAGSRAEVVIANGNGITCSGCGFINTSRAVLTTGTPLLDSTGNLSAFRVTGGTVSFTGAGMNASNVDQVDVLARAVELNAALYANQLDIVTGTNQIDHNTLSATPIAGTSVAPAFGLDVSQLGGMYAQRIVLVGTEAGVGVNDGGTIAAQTGDLSLSTQGQLTVAGSINAAGNLNIAARGGVSNSGAIYGLQSTTVNSVGDITSSGTIAGQNQVFVNGQNVSSSGTLAAGVDPSGHVGTGGDLTVVAGNHLAANGQNIAGGSATLQGSSVDLSGSKTSATGNLSISASAGDVNLSGATTQAGQLATITAPAGTVRNDAISSSQIAQITAQQISINAAGLSNRGGSIQQTGTAGTGIQISGAFDNSGGSVTTNAADLVLHAGSIANAGGQIHLAGNGALSITTGVLGNQGGAIASNGTLGIVAAGMDNTGGSLASTGAASVVATGALTNVNGTIESAKGLSVSAGSVSNSGGRIQSDDTSGLNVQVAGSLTNAPASGGTAGGFIGGNGNVTVTAGSIVNSGTISGAQQLDVTAGQTLDNSSGTLAARSVALNAASLTNRRGRIVQSDAQGKAALNVTNTLDNSSGGSIQVAASSLSLTPQTLNNAGGTISHAGSGTLSVRTAGALTNDGGALGTNGVATITAGTVSNRGGTLSAVGAESVSGTSGVDNSALNGVGGYIGGASVAVRSPQGAVNNSGGLIEASAGTANVSGQGVTNDGGTIRALGSSPVTVTAAGALSNRGGTIGGRQDVSVSGGSIDNSSGALVAMGNLGANSSGALTNDGGLFEAQGNINASASGPVSNRGGKIEAVGSGSTLTLGGSTIDNTNGAVTNAGSGATTVTATASLTNANPSGAASTGLIAGNGDVNVNAPVVLNTSGGQIASGQALTLNAPSQVNNNGGALTAGGALTVNQPGTALTNVGGSISGASVSLVTASVDNTNGQIVNSPGSASDISIQTGALTNTNGTVASARDLSVTATSLVGDGKLIGGRDARVALQGNYANSAANQITANRNLTFSTTGTFTNAGTLAAAGNLTLNAASVVNQAGADIASGNAADPSTGTTTINAAGGDINNAGRIEGNTVTTTSNTLENTGTIIGGTVNATANTLTNDGAAAIIAGTNGVNLWVPGTLNNQNSATLFSLGDINIAANGARDANGNLVNQTGTVNNLSSTIGADGNLNIAANQINNVWQNIQTTTTTTSSTYMMSQLPWWQPVGPGATGPFQDANTDILNAYYLNPADIVSATPYVTPDGYVITKVVVNIPANVSAFEWKQGGLTYSQPNGGQNVQYQEDSRLSVAPGQMVLYAENYSTGNSNPDQRGGTAWPQYSNYTAVNQLGTTTYSSQYGDCTTNCVRVEAYPGYTDPTTQMLKGTERRLPATSPYQIETKRQATETVATTTVAATSGTQALITSGGAMNLTIGSQLANSSGSIAAGGNLNIDGQALPNGGSNTKIVNTATQLSTTYSFSNLSGYPNIWTGTSYDPPQSWQAWTNPSITMATGTVGGTITSNQAVSISGGQISNTSVRAASGPAGQSATALGLSTVSLAGTAANGAQGSVAGGTALSGSVRLVDGARAAALSATLPASGLYRVASTPALGYLVQTDPRFTSYSNFISSDYMLGLLGINPMQTQKRLGDGFYETQLVQQQVTQLTGRRYLPGYASNEQEYQQLMTNGATVAKQFGLEPGVALTDAQMAALTENIVWMVSETVTLPDGASQTVLVPQVYLAKSDDATLSPSGALIAGDSVAIKGTDVTNNAGTIASRTNTVVVASNDIQNIGGLIAGNNVGLVAGHDIVNQSVTDTETARFATGTSTHTSIGAVGQIQAKNSALVIAGHDVDVLGAQISAGNSLGVSAGNAVNVGAVQTSSDVTTSNGFNTDHRTSTTQAGSTLSAGGNLGVVSAGDININASRLDAGGDMTVAASGNVAITSATDSSMIDSRGSSGNVSGAYHYDQQTNAASSLSAGGNATVLAGAQQLPGGGIVLPSGGGATGKSLTLQGSSIVAGGNGQGSGAVTLGATGDVNIVEAHDQSNFSDTLHQSSGGFLSHKTVDTQRTFSTDTSAGSLVSGDAVYVQSGNNLTVRGSDVVGMNGVGLAAAGNVDITAAHNTEQESSYYDVKRSGLSGSGGLGFTIGSSEQKDQYNGSSVTQSQSRSTVGAVQGNVSVKAGQNVHIGGSDLVAGVAAGDTTGATGNIAIRGQNITVDPGQDAAQSHDAQETRSSGLTVGVTGTPFDTVRNLKDASSSGNAYHRATGVSNEMAAAPLDTPSVTMTYGSNRSSSTTETSSVSNAGSTIRGGGNVSLTATGGARKDANGNPVDGDITVTGSAISAGGTALLDANRNVTLQASTDQYTQGNQSSSSSTSFQLASPSLGDLSRWVQGGPNNGGVSSSPYNASRSSSDGNASSTQQTASTVTGNSVVVKSHTGDINVVGSGISGTQGVDLVATQGAINVLAGTDTSQSHQESGSHQIGDLGGNGTGTGFSVGASSSHTVQDTAAQTQSTIRSQIVSGKGNVTLDAKQDVTVQGSDLAAGKDLTLIGKNLNLDPGSDAQQSSMSQSSSQFGVTLALSGAAGNAVAAANQSMGGGANTGGDARLSALGKAQAALSAYNAYQVAGQFAAGSQNMSQPLVKVTVSVGGGKSESQSQSSSVANDGSTLTAGGTVNLIATGSGTKDAGGFATDGDINAAGTQISGQNVVLNAARDINLQSAKDTSQQTGSNSSAGGSVGVGFGLGGQQNGFTVELAANTANGHLNGNSTTNRNTQVTAADTVSVTSGRDTTLNGAQVTGNTVNANVGRDLTVASPQDTGTYDSQQTSGGFQVSVCVPPICYGSTVSGSASASDQTIKSSYQSVGQQQSGIYAGNGGFNINVGNHTQLDGGVIASTATPDLNTLSTQTFGYTNLQNHAEYSGSTVGFSMSGQAGESSPQGVSFASTPTRTGSSLPGPQNSQGLGPTGFGVAGTGDSASGTTYAAVSPGSITVRGDAGTGQDSTAGLSRDTASANGSVANKFDAQTVSNDMAIQQGVGQVGMQVVGDVATYLEDQAKTNQTKALLTYQNAVASGDTATAARAWADYQAASTQAALWDENGIARTGSHALVAGVSAAMGGGNIAGAIGGTIAGDVVGNAVSGLAGDTPGGAVLSNIVSGAAGALAGGAIGGTTGAMSGANGALDASLYNRQLHKSEKDRLQQKANQIAASIAQNPQDQATIAQYWNAMLTVAASAAVDTQAAQQLNTYINQLAAAAQASGNYAPLNLFLADLGTAQRDVSSMAGQALIGTTGVPIVADGSVVKSFQATAAQANDHLLFANGPLGSMYQFGPGNTPTTTGWDPSRSDPVQQRIQTLEQNTLELASARNGAATPVYDVEQYIVGAIAGGLTAGAIDAIVARLAASSADAAGVFDIGANITPLSTANKYRFIGANGTFVTPMSSIESIVGPISQTATEITISRAQASALEGSLGLNPGSLESSNVLSIVADVSSRAPRSPLSGNNYFMGAGQGLPGGGQELVIDAIPSAGGQGIRQIIVKVK